MPNDSQQAIPGALALVRVPVAPVHAEPRVSSQQTTQTAFGRVVVLGRPDGAWYQVRTTPDQYEGWLHSGYFTVIEGATSSDLAPLSPGNGGRPPDLPIRVALGCTVRAGGRTLRLPLGAWIGPDVTVLDGEAVAMTELPARFAAAGEAVVRTASRYFGSTSYQWGGVTPWGADCSGFVQAVYALHGIDLPRDAWQQAEIGVALGAATGAHGVAEAAAGDLLFFSERADGRVTHVGIATGDGGMLHVALGRGGFAAEDLAADDGAYAAGLRARYTGGRRVLGARPG